MMTISESNYSSKNMSTVHTLNNKVIHQDSFNDVQQSSSTNSALVTNRGFKPSDMFDPQKKEFLTNLSYKLFPVSWNDEPKERDMSPTRFLSDNEPNPYEKRVEMLKKSNHEEEFGDTTRSPITVGDKEIDLNKIFTPAPDADEHLIKKNKTTFASSSFYSTGLHPTVKDQMELARKISSSLSEPANQLSKGQSMYVNRKKRSVKWVHEGKGRNTSNSCATPTPSSNHDTPYRPPSSTQKPLPTVKYSTLPKSFTTPSKPQPVNVLPKMEAFPNTVPVLSPLPDLYIPPLQSKLNEVYSSPTPTAISQWNSKNYNTAARGWGEIKSYYRPVTFDDRGNCNTLQVSNF